MIIAICFIGLGAFAQDNSGIIKGQLIDSLTREAVPFAHVHVMVNGSAMGSVTDFDGKFTIKPVPSGEYVLKCSSTGYSTKKIKNVKVKSDQFTLLGDITMFEGLMIDEFTVEAPVRLIDQGDGVVSIISGKEMGRLAVKTDINQVIGVMAPGVKVSEDGQQIYFRGSRNGNVIYLVDGVKIRGGKPVLPSSGIKSLAVYTGGMPAKYGDTTGGVVVVETKSYFDMYYASLKDK